MNKNLFWNELTQESKEMVKKWLGEYNNSESIASKVFELYEIGANQLGLILEEYAKKVDPNRYVKLRYKLFINKIID